MATRVLIVEDDKFKADDLRREIANGFSIFVVASVRDAVVKVLEKRSTLWFSTWLFRHSRRMLHLLVEQLQPQGGVEVLRALKSVKTETPVIIVSQYPDLEIDGEFYSLLRSPKVLSERYGIRVVGAVVYDFQNRAWTDVFRGLLNEL